MKKAILKVMAKAAEKSIVTANRTACSGFTYQPKAPKDIKNFKKWLVLIFNFFAPKPFEGFGRFFILRQKYLLIYVE